ncbi:MAG: TonB-dependent receptor [Proteobacteria bacterium]|nr:TonB-dependent receptor [Pseudomonadota bacterium]
MIDRAGKYPSISLVAALALVWMNGNARAADEDAYFSELPIVASVSRLPQRLADTPAAVTVVDREMIKASGARDLSDIFRLVPGFQTYPNNTEAARATYHGLGDGDYAPRVQVLIDGRSMLSPLFGSGVNWATLPVALEDIERIEVVRGTNAVSYGSNAFLGVINIITIDPALVRGFSVSTNYGNQNVRDYGFRTGGKIGEVGDFRFTYRHQNDDGLTDRFNWIDSYRSRLFDFRADFVLSERDILQLSLGQVEGVTQTGRLNKTTLQMDPTNPFRDLRQTDSYVQLLWRRVLSNDSDMQMRYSYVSDESTDAFTVPLPGLAPIHVNQSGDQGLRHEIELQHSLRAFEVARLVWGGSWRADSLRSEWTLRDQGTVKRDVGRVFGNIELKPAKWFTGNVGLAVENDSLAGAHVSPRVSTNFHFNPQNTVRFGLSRAYRTGSIQNYRGREETPVPKAYPGYEFIYVGNPEMPAERLDTVEVGYLGDWRDWRSSLDVRIFSERVPNRLYRMDLGVSNNNVPKGTVPIQDVRIEGVEYQFKWQPFDSTRLVLNQTFARITNEFLASALALSGSELSVPSKRFDASEFTNNSMPSRSTSLMWIQKLPLGFEFSLMGYAQQSMQWSTNTVSKKYRRWDTRLGYPFRLGGVGGELALTIQSLNGAHNEYKATRPDDSTPDSRIVERRQWVSLRLDF